MPASIAKLLAAAGALTMSRVAAAQAVDGGFLASEAPFDVSRGENISVLERPRPDYQAVGVRVGGFTLHPKMRLGSGYSDNAYGAEVDRRGDAYGALDPAVELASNWSRHSLGFTAGAALRRFAEETRKNETGLFAGAVGRVELGDSWVQGAARVRRAYESQYSPSFPTALGASIPFTQTTGELRGNLQGSRFRVVGFGDLNRFRFGDGRQRDDVPFDQRGRDRTVLRGSGRIELAATPDAAAFVQASYAGSDYDDAQALFGLPNRDSHEFRVLGGATFDVTQLIRGAIGLGYVRRRYDASVYGAISGVSGEARVEYFPTQLTTVTLVARRVIEDAVSAGSGGYFGTVAALRVDHELRRNVLLNLQGGYERDRFNNVSRRDRAYRINAGVDYLFNRRVGMSLGAVYANRKSSGAPLGLSFDELRGAASLSYQL